MYKCPQCGKRNKDDARFCDDCGATLRKEMPESVYDRDSGSVKMVDSSEPLSAPIDYSKKIKLDFGSRSDYGSGTGPSVNKNSTINVFAFAISLLSLFMCFGCLSPVSLVLSIIAFSMAKKENDHVTGLPLVALILSICGTFEFMMLFLVALFSNR